MKGIQMNTTLGAPTEAQIEAYLDANRKYWQDTDKLPPPPSRWRTGTPEEATRAGLIAAFALHPAPSAALAAPVASPEPVDVEVVAAKHGYSHDVAFYRGFHAGRAIAPSPPTTPPARPDRTPYATEAEGEAYTDGYFDGLAVTTPSAAEPGASKRATGFVAPKDRYVTPVLFSPYTGEPRDARDIHSDPQGILIVPPGARLLAATPPAPSTTQGLSDAAIADAVPTSATILPANPPKVCMTRLELRDFARAILAANKETK